MAFTQASTLNSLVGKGSRLEGKFFVDGMFRIDGDFVGALCVNGKLIASAHSRIAASICARSAIIGGLIKGDVYVTETLHLLQGAQIVGNVFAPRIEVQDSQAVHGEICVQGSSDSVLADLENFARNHNGLPYLFERFSESFKRVEAWRK